MISADAAPSGSSPSGGAGAPVVPTDREANSGSQVVMLALVAALGGFLFGYDSAVINGGVNAIGERFDLSPGMLGFVVSCALLGAMAGAWFAGSLADRIGRTRAMVVAAIFFTLSAIGSWATVTAWDLVLWRALGGAGIGMASVLAPAYIAEISPSQVRGRLGSLQQLAIVVGLFSALLVDAWLAGLAGGAAQDLWFGLEAWRWMFLSELLPALVYGALALSIPESPRFMVAQGKEAEAAHLLRDVVGLRGEEVEAKLDDIRATINTEKRQTLSDLAGAAAGLKPIVWIGILLSVFQQFVGINVIFYFGSTLWQAVGFGESQALLINVGTSITNIVVTVVAILIVDRVGRRPMLLAGSAGMTLSLAAMALAFSHATVSGSGAEQSVSLPDPWGPIALAAANLFIVAFGITWGPIVWVLLGEMFPNNIRSVALGVAAAAQWLANFVITTTFPWLADVSLTLAYGLYAAFSLLSLVFVWRYVGETRGKELEEMGDGAHQRVAAPVPA